MTLLNIIDLEATCWEGDPPPGQVHEVIEIGVCVLNLDSLERSGKRSIMVKPARSQVSAFCTHLTGITPQEAEGGLSFAQALELLRREYQADSRPWASWGDYDRKQLQAQCEQLSLTYPLCARHTNAKKVFTEALGLKKRPGMDGALQLAGLPLEGRHHRGADDAWNIAALVAHVLGNGLREAQAFTGR